MYEIWLAWNIVWEMALAAWPLVLAAAVAWVLLVTVAWRRPGARPGAALPTAILWAAVGAIAAFVVVPGAVGSSLTELGYWVDVANLAAIAVACGAVVGAFAWPLATLFKTRIV
ncbi:MAG: hypothetical protein JNM79_07060 [Burkholderiales bacterium]|nr:hypothetical protein [Burkholderiales bacterium]